MKLTLQQAHHILQQEIEWCQKHPDKKLSADFQDGFVKGIQQAQLILKSAEEEVKDETK